MNLKALIVFEKQEDRDLWAFFLESRFNFEVHLASNLEEALVLLDLEEKLFHWIICYNYNCAQRLIALIFGKNLKTRLICVTPSFPEDPLLLRRKEQIYFLHQSSSISQIEEFFLKVLDSKIDNSYLGSYCRIKINLLLHANPLMTDVYLKNPDENLSLVKPKGLDFEQRDYENFKNLRALDYLFLSREFCSEIANQIQNSIKIEYLNDFEETSIVPISSMNQVINQVIEEKKERIEFLEQKLLDIRQKKQDLFEKKDSSVEPMAELSAPQSDTPIENSLNPASPREAPIQSSSTSAPLSDAPIENSLNSASPKEAPIQSSFISAPPREAPIQSSLTSAPPKEAPIQSSFPSAPPVQVENQLSDDQFTHQTKKEPEKNRQLEERRQKLLEEAQKHLIAQVDSIYSLSNQLGFNEEVQEFTRQSVLTTINKIKQAPKLSSVLIRLELDEEKYIASHSILLAFVSCAIASKLEWNSDTTSFKLTLAALLHDITLKNHKLASIQSLTELREKQALFSDEEMKAFYNHPADAAACAQKFDEIPSDVDLILSQHHERPDGSGFPKGLTSTRICPLSVVFIIAHDLVDFVLGKDKSQNRMSESDLKEFVANYPPQYIVGNFKRVLVAVSKMKT